MTERTLTNRALNRRRFLRTLGTGLVGAALGGYGTGAVLNGWRARQTSAPLPVREGVGLQPVTITTESGVRVHRVQTGYVAVKSVHRDYSGPDGRGIPAIIADATWTEWMPIPVWVIEHPEGIAIVDTGEDPRVNDPDYYACDQGSAFFYGAFLRFDVTPHEAVDVQLRGLGIRPSDVRWVVQTHPHGDHVNGLQHFENSEVLWSARDWPSVQGAVPCTFPSWLNPTLVTYSEDDTPVFGRSYEIAEGLRIVPTPGHTPGHQSVLLDGSDKTYFFAGDTSFDTPQMLNDGVAGIVAQPGESRSTTATIRAYAEAVPTVYLPSHDADTARRLVEGETVTV